MWFSANAAATEEAGGSILVITRELVPRFGASCPEGQRSVSCNEFVQDAREQIIGGGILEVTQVAVDPASYNLLAACADCFLCPIEVLDMIEHIYECFLDWFNDEEHGLVAVGHVESGPVGPCVC